MRKVLFMFALTLIIFGINPEAWCFDSGSTGADGVFNPATNTEVQLPGNGILNYITVNIPTGVTVTFKKNTANTPVYILATGDVTIAGTISLNGTDGNIIYPGRGGPGGFDGGLGGTPGLVGGKGLGPGGGNEGYLPTSEWRGGGGAGFGTSGTNGVIGGTGGGTYSNMEIIPLIGGSGGGGGSSATSSSGGGGGGGGGGAILIASNGTINITGSITAKGGKGWGGDYNSHSGGGGGGSGGTIKLMANSILGEGAISAIGGAGGLGGYNYDGGSGGSGRIRLEANTVTRTAATTPSYTYSHPGTVFVSYVPTLKITSIGGANVPDNPSGKYGSPDVILPSNTTNPVTVNISATNVPVNTQVTVTSVPEYDASTNATGTLSGTDTSSTTSVSITISTLYQCILMAQATFTIQQAMYWDDEKIEKVRVATKLGSGSEVVYITKSGKEIKSDELMARLMR